MERRGFTAIDFMIGFVIALIVLGLVFFGYSVLTGKGIGAISFVKRFFTGGIG